MNWDYWFLARRQWIESLQPKPNDDYIDPMLYAVLGILLTAILMIWGA